MTDQLKIILKKHGINFSDELLKDLIDAQNQVPNEIVEKYNLLFNHSHLSYQSLDIDGNIIEVNPMWLKVLGYKKDEVIGKWFGDFLHQDYIEPFKVRFERFKKLGSIEDAMFRMKKSNGEFILVLLKGCILYDPNGEFKCTYCSFLDISEEEEILNRLKENEERYLIAQEMGNVGNWEYNVQTGHFWGSDQAKRIYGFNPEKDEFTTDEIENCIVDRERIHQALIDLIETKKEYKLEFEIIPKNSKKSKIIFSFAQLHHDEKGDALKVVGVIQDITEQKKAEQALRESEEKYRKLTENSPEITYINNLNKGALYWSSKIKDVLGFDPNNIVEDTTEWTKSLHKEDIPKINEILKNIEVGKTYELEYRIYDVHKNLHWFYDRIFNVSEKDGDIILEGIISDITRKKQIEDELKESEERFKNLSHLTFEGIVFHKNAKAIDCNESFLKLFKYKRNEIINSNLLNVIHPDYHHKIKENIVKEFAEPYEVLGVKKDGIVFPIEIEARNVIIENKQIRVAAIRDITERKKNEENLRQKNEELHELNATKDKFFSIIAHDLRGPINNLVGFSDLLERNHLNYEKDKLSHIISLMSTSAKRTYTLLENLLIWSKSQRNKISFNPQTYVCKELITEVIEEMEHLALAKNLSFNTDKEYKDISVWVDRDMFKTVFRNLISNAIKFTRENGEISIGCSTQNDHFVEFFVKDNGVGISKESINKLFRIDETITTEGTNHEKGTGLGLVLCKDFVEKHRGKIWVESEIEKGSTFRFTFPLTENK